MCQVLIFAESKYYICDGGMNEAEGVHLSFLNGGLVFVQFHSLHGHHILCAGAVSDIRKGLSAANLVTRINLFDSNP